jgi:hypothetical protein
LPAVLQRKTPHQAMGKDQNNKRAKIQKNKLSQSAQPLKITLKNTKKLFRTWLTERGSSETNALKREKIL